MFTKVINEDLLLLVDVATLKRHCRIDHDLDDNLLEMYLLAAHYAAGEFTRRRPFNTEAAGMFERYSPKVFMPGGNVRQVLSIQALSPNRGMVNVDFSFNPIAEQVSIPLNTQITQTSLFHSSAVIGRTTRLETTRPRS